MLATLPYSGDQLSALAELAGDYWRDAKDPSMYTRSKPFSLTAPTVALLRKAMEALGTAGFSATIGELARRYLATAPEKGKRRAKRVP